MKDCVDVKLVITCPACKTAFEKMGNCAEIVHEEGYQDANGIRSEPDDDYVLINCPGCGESLRLNLG